jgi:HME family heavy-metal exporter
VRIEGQFQAQEEAQRALIAWLAAGVAGPGLPGAVFGRYRSARAGGHGHGQHPAGAGRQRSLALWLSGQPLSVAALVGFITLTGIATRNGILKISHYLQPLHHSRASLRPTPMILRGARAPDAGADDRPHSRPSRWCRCCSPPMQPGKEILHPVAVVIFGGLVSSTLLDTLLTPAAVPRWGQQPLERLLRESSSTAY